LLYAIATNPCDAERVIFLAVVVPFFIFGWYCESGICQVANV